MKRAALTVALLMLTSCTVKAQDTYVPEGLRSTCEWLSGERCVPGEHRRAQPRPRIVHIPVTTMRAYKHVPEHLVPLHKREAEVRGWKHRDSWLRPGARCWPVKVKAYSDEKVARDGRAEAIRRWSGMVRSELGELFMDFRHAIEKSEQCWQSSTGERLTDKMTGGNERCMVEARPCRAERTKEADDE